MKVLQIKATYDLGPNGTIVKDIRECCEENSTIDISREKML